MTTDFIAVLERKLDAVGWGAADLATHLDCDETTVTKWLAGQHLPRQNDLKEALASFLDITEVQLEKLIRSSTGPQISGPDYQKYLGYYFLYQWEHGEDILMRTALHLYKLKSGRYEFTEDVELKHASGGKIRGKMEVKLPNIYLHGKGQKGFQEHEFVIMHLNVPKTSIWYPAMVLGIGSLGEPRPVASAAVIKFLGVTEPSDFSATTGELKGFDLPQAAQDVLLPPGSRSKPNRIKCEIDRLRTGNP